MTTTAGRGRAWMAVASFFAMTGCSTIGAWRAGEGGAASEADEWLGAGLISVSSEGRQLQLIGHVFEMPASALDRRDWTEACKQDFARQQLQQYQTPPVGLLRVSERTQ